MGGFLLLGLLGTEIIRKLSSFGNTSQRLVCLKSPCHLADEHYGRNKFSKVPLSRFYYLYISLTPLHFP